MDIKKGFITVATGNYYCWLAENLVMSYKLFSNTKYPMFVMTDKKGEKRLKKLFDGVIVLDKPYYSFMDKMTVYQKSPFEETIFLDADMNIVRDISYLFDEFNNNNSSVSCVGSFRSIDKWGKPVHFGEAAIKHYNINRYIAFGGGIYYYKKCNETDDFFQFVFDELVPNYSKFQLKKFRNGHMADEPLIGLAMLVKGMKPLDSPKDIMKFHDTMMKTLKWDMKSKECRFVWWENKLVSPTIVHYGTHNTYSKKYVYYNSIVRCKYKRTFPILLPLEVIYNEVILLIRHMFNPSDRAAFYSWFKAHFTKEHLRHRKQQISALFKQ